MKKILYLTNIEVPYRVKFFNELAKECDLAVMYERRMSANRNNKWASEVKKKYAVEYLDGMNIGDEYGFSLHILNLIRRKWDVVIVGCYNSKVQILAMAYMRLFRMPFIINLDGESFIDTSGRAKAFVKKIMLGKAWAYLTAGVKAEESLRKVIGNRHPIIPYYFSSLTDAEVKNNAMSNHMREEFVLVIGQYFKYKGMDIALKVACMDSSIRYKFVGMGKRTDLFVQEMGELPQNVEIVPFLQKEELETEYQKCALMLLPTRQECWGLVVNEAASFGTPIVSTWGCGAAVEFISDDYSCFLAKPGDAGNLYKCLKLCLESDNTAYSEYLRKRSKHYSIEKGVTRTMELIREVCLDK